TGMDLASLVGQDQGFLARTPRQALGHADHVDAGDAEFLQHLQRLRHLAAAAVDQQHVGFRTLAFGELAETPGQRLVHRRVVVAGRDAADVEAAVMRLLRPFRPEHHAGRHGEFAAGVADVEALEAPRRFGQFQQALQVLEARAQGLPAGKALGQRGLRIALGHLQEARAFAAHAALQLHRVAALFRQHFGEHGLLGQLLAQDQLARHRAVQVVLRHELRQHVGRFGIQRQAREEVARAQADAVAEEQHADAGQARLDAAGDHVHVGAGALYMVLRLQLTQGGHLVAQRSGALEVEFRAGLLHRRGQLVDHRAAAPFEEHLGVSHVAGVILFRDQPHARGGAAADLVLQAGARAVAEIAVLALAHLEQLLHQTQALAHREGAWIRSEIAPWQILRTTVEGQSRIVLAAGQIDVRVALVVAQHDVVARLQRLDQLRFQQQRLAFGARDGDVAAGDLRDHRRDARFQPGLQEIAAHALLQVAGLAHVQEFAGRVEIAVDAGRGGQGADEGLAVEGGRRVGWHAGILAGSRGRDRYHRSHCRWLYGNAHGLPSDTDIVRAWRAGRRLAVGRYGRVVGRRHRPAARAGSVRRLHPEAATAALSGLQRLRLRKRSTRPATPRSAS